VSDGRVPAADVPLVLATRSVGKLWELRPMFAEAGLQVVDLGEIGVSEAAEEAALECYSTFEENALAKARYFASRTGRPVVADDSGLEVRGLGERPGVFSKRWSGRDDLAGRALDAANNAKLVAELERVTDRAARYVCAAAFVEGGREIVRRGETPGVIVMRPRGSEGFGYDPYFESAELRRTFGESSREEKARVSHRGRAFRALIAALRGGVG
jgi:XTP/dITP diphosphohydrolase